MTPLKISYTTRGKERGSVIAEDGVTAVLDTPAGQATGVSQKLPAIGRVAETRFPGDSKAVKLDEKKSFASDRRRKEYQTEKGTVVIEAECY